jgi:hypothetical protein
VDNHCARRTIRRRANRERVATGRLATKRTCERTNPSGEKSLNDRSVRQDIPKVAQSFNKSRVT